MGLQKERNERPKEVAMLLHENEVSRAHGDEL